jgi:hypothetical protein
MAPGSTNERDHLSPLCTESVVCAAVWLHVSPRFPQLWILLWIHGHLSLQSAGHIDVKEGRAISPRETKRRYFHQPMALTLVEKPPDLLRMAEPFRNRCMAINRDAHAMNLSRTSS